MGMDVFGEFGSLLAEDMEGIGPVILAYLVMALIGWLFSVAVYVLQSVGLYSIAKRRGIHHAWMAWVPVTNMWTLGSISDQYQFVAKGKVKNRRKTLLGLQIAMTACMTLIFVLAFILGFSALEAEMNGSGMGMEMVGPAMFMMIVYFALMVISIVLAVFQYIACYDLFASCSPNNSVLFLVLSIFINITLPFFIFAVRNQDEGMPPRRAQTEAAQIEPVTFTQPEDTP